MSVIMHQRLDKENTENLQPLLCSSRTLTCSAVVPRKTGMMYMFQGRRKLRVRLTLHHSYCERFVVVSQDKVLCKDWGYINLGNCTVRETGDNGFQILPRDGDGDTLTFAVPSQQEVKDWVQVLNMSRPQGASPLRLALTPNPSPKSLTSKKIANLKRQSTLLPALEEE